MYKIYSNNIKLLYDCIKYKFRKLYISSIEKLFKYIK